jgi:hypothetical protein
MPEVTYLAEVECDVVVPNGILDTQVIRVADTENHSHALRVAKGWVVEEGGKKYLPIGLIYVDYRGKRALIELPQEADSGTRRVWVPFARFRRQDEGDGQSSQREHLGRVLR